MDRSLFRTRQLRSVVGVSKLVSLCLAVHLIGYSSDAEKKLSAEVM